MLDLKKIDGPYGIPIYYQRMPEMVKSVSMAWVMFTGASDDMSIGLPGLHHWFEHVPFRGTKKFPKGSADIEGPFVSMNGDINAFTDQTSTCYHGTFHVSQWRQGLETLTDMVANPLITESGVEAERRVIHQEIIGKLGSAKGKASYNLLGLLYPEHQFGHPVLGSEKTLAGMDANTLQHAHKAGYDRSRAMLVFIGSVPEEEFLREALIACSELPARGLSERRKPYFHGSLPEWSRRETVIETEFASSVIHLLFPLPGNMGEVEKIAENTFSSLCLDGMFEHGGLTSPLSRIVREERQLVYGAATVWTIYPGGGYYGFKAEAKKENIEAIIQAFRDVIQDPAVKMPERLAQVKSSTRAEMEMEAVNTDDYLMGGINIYKRNGGVMKSAQEYLDAFTQVTIDDIERMHALVVNPANARLVVFKGMGS